MAITPNLGSEWSPTERFLSGPAQHPRVTRPFVDVQSVLCRTAPSTSHAPGFNRFNSATSTQQPNNRLLRGKTNTKQTILTCGEVLVEWLDGTHGISHGISLAIPGLPSASLAWRKTLGLRIMISLSFSSVRLASILFRKRSKLAI